MTRGFAGSPCAVLLAVALCLGWGRAAGSDVTPPGAPAPGGGAAWTFVDATAAAGLSAEHGFLPDTVLSEPHWMSGGAAAADVDGDGWTDLFVVRGELGPGLLFRNRGDGTFEEIAAAIGLAVGGVGAITNGPAFGDVDGDGDPDLLLGGIEGAEPRLFANQLDEPGVGRFVEVTADSGLFAGEDTFSSGFGDIDGDGDLDLFSAHWSGPVDGGLPAPHLWRNDGGVFLPIDFLSGVVEPYRLVDWTFTPRFVDLEDDGDLDLLVAGDFGTSQVFRNLGDGTFEVATTAAIDDENGMGAALGDFDADGDFDWLVTSIWDPDGVNEAQWGVTGNRFYRNDGGSFSEVTDAAGVREGYWGWGVCAADFDLDGALDVAHVNGFQALPAVDDFFVDPARLFLGQGDGSFVEASAVHGFTHTGQGRGIVCFDADRDGDIDVYVTSNEGPTTFYRNERTAPGAWLGVRLLDAHGGPAVGAVVAVEAPSGAVGVPARQIRRIHADSNYLSQDPAEAHFGLGALPLDARVTLEIRWPDGTLEVVEEVAIGDWTTRRRGGSSVVDVPSLSAGGLVAFALVLLGLALASLRRTLYSAGGR
ncbi:MAG: CRTAC1 family protein [Acidobacteriota bacterium]